MKKVTFKTQCKVKEGRKWVTKEFEVVEFTSADEQSIRLRAMALNWTLVKIEVMG